VKEYVLKRGFIRRKILENRTATFLTDLPLDFLRRLGRRGESTGTYQTKQE